jgi:hypothetical protein
MYCQKRYKNSVVSLALKPTIGWQRSMKKYSIITVYVRVNKSFFYICTNKHCPAHCTLMYCTVYSTSKPNLNEELSNLQPIHQRITTPLPICVAAICLGQWSISTVGVGHKVQTYKRVPQCMSPRWNWDSPTPSLASECAPPPGTKGWGGTLACGWGVGESQFQRLDKKLSTLPTLWCCRKVRG